MDERAPEVEEVPAKPQSLLEAIREEQDRRRAAGLCPWCGGERDKRGCLSCSKCLKLRGTCYRRPVKGDPGGPGATVKDRRRAAGLCIYCGGERDSEYLGCSSCLEKHRKQNLKKGIRKGYASPGRPKGSHHGRWTHWSKADKAIIADADARGIKTKELWESGKLPGRSMIDIQNQFGILRVKRRGVCPKCRKDKGTKGMTCEGCKAEARQERRDSIAQGLCASCRRPRGADGTATECRMCANAKREYVYPTKSAPSKPSKLMVAWPSARGCLGVVDLVKAAEFPRVVDVFCGGGRIATRVGPSLVAMNDIHPLLMMMYEQARADVGDLWARVRSLQEEIMDPQEMAARYARAFEVRDPVEGPPLFWMMARATWQGGNMRTRKVMKLPYKDRAFQARARRFVEATGHAEYLNLDFAEVIRRYDRPDTLFVLDPPWLGPFEERFEFDLNGRFEEMMDLLASLQGHYVLAMGSSEQCRELLVGRVPHLYWMSVFKSFEFFGTSFPLPESFTQKYSKRLRFVPQAETIDLGMSVSSVS